MKRLSIYSGDRTYMSPGSELWTPEVALTKFPAILTFTHIAETDESGQVIFGAYNLAAMRNLHNIPTTLTDEEAIHALEEIINMPPLDPEVTPEDVNASLAVIAELEALEDSELKHSVPGEITYTPLQARYANYFVRGLWTKRHVALSVRKGRLTVEQFSDIVGEEYIP